MAEQPSGNKYTTDSRGEPTPMPRVLRPANPNPPLPGARTKNTSILTTPRLDGILFVWSAIMYAVLKLTG
ncbi:hypothetical protein ACVWZ9_002935 [Pseudomonas chlororaphis]